MKTINLFALILALCVLFSSCAFLPNSDEITTASNIESITESDTSADSSADSEESSQSSSEIESVVTQESESSEGEKCEQVNFFMINDNHGSFVGDSNSAGVERLAGLLEKITASNGNYIKIANGDILQGSYISSTLRGLPMIEALNEMKFDCFVIGNHEFDWGIEEIEKYADGDESNGEADFPFLGANIYDKRTGKRVEWIDPYIIIEYEGRRIGVIGVIGDDLESSILTSKVANYEFVNYTEIVADYASELRGKGCDVVAVATHDYDEGSNKALSSLSGQSRIDAIFCGHSHQKINTSSTRTDGYAVPIVQNWGDGDLATSLILNLKNDASISYKVEQYQVKNMVKKASMTENVINKYAEMISASNRVVGQTSSALSKDDMGELCCNSMVEILEADISMVNTGGIRSSIYAGDITVAEIFAVFPFENAVVKVSMTGTEIKRLYDANSSYLYFNSDFNPASLDASKTYSVAVIDYVYENPRYTSLFSDLPYEYTNNIMRDLVIDYIEDSLSVSVVIPYYSVI